MAMNKAEKQMVKDLRIRTALRMELNALPDVLPPKYGEPCEITGTVRFSVKRKPC
jgi:hypothetical protein